MENIEMHLTALIRELQGSYIELSHFIAYHSDHLTEEEIDRLAEELEGDYLSLKEYVMNALNI